MWESFIGKKSRIITESVSAMALDAVRELLSLNCGSLVAYQLDKHSQVDSISYQTILMREIFIKHPSVVLIHRSHSPRGKALYMFMVDEPFLRLEGEMTRVVHLSVPSRESAEGLAHMYHTFKAFNPEWKQIKTFLVDPGFRLLPTLSKAFPSADVQLSVFHLCKYLQHTLHQASLECHMEKLILSALQNAMCAPSESNRRVIHVILNNFVKPNLISQLRQDWLLSEKIWTFHCWRTWNESNQYFKVLELITRSLSQEFCVGSSLEACMISIAKQYQKSTSGNSVSPPATLLNHNVLLPSSSPTDTRRARLPQDLPPMAPQATSEPKEEVANEFTAREAERLIQQSLTDLCTEPAARLCLKEMAVVQSSLHLKGTDGQTVNIQLLENAQTVECQEGLSSCTCYFSQTFQLPCRHILALLNSEGKDLNPERIPIQWHKGSGTSQPRETSADGLLEVLSSSWDEVLDKYMVVSLLTTEISRLLRQCSPEEFDRRYSTLRELADNWIGPYVQVKL